MNRFYVYEYVRKDGTPYYIGKGTRYRHWAKHVRTNGSNITPSDRSRIRKVADNLTEEEALELEEFLIEELGRKEDGGILVNLKHGGQSGTGFVPTDKTRELMRQAKLGTTRPAIAKKRQSESSKKFWETFDSTERDRKISEALKGRVIGCKKKKSIAAKKRYRPPVSCLLCNKEGKMPTMVAHFRKCEENHDH